MSQYFLNPLGRGAPVYPDELPWLLLELGGPKGPSSLGFIVRCVNIPFKHYQLSHFE